MATILVTGAAGFIGYHTSAALLACGHKVIGIDNINDYYDISLKHERLSKLSNMGDSWVFHKVCISDREAVFSLLAGEYVDYIIHLAAQAGVRYSIEAPQAYIDANITGTMTMLDVAREKKVKHFLFASSSSVYGEESDVPFNAGVSLAAHPISMYAATKRSNEMMAHVYAHLHGLPCTGLRFFTVYGPLGRPDMAPMKFAKALLDGDAIDVYNNGEQYRDFTYVGDIVEGILGLLDALPEPLNQEGRLPPDRGNAPYRVFNIGAQNPVHLMDFIRTLERTLGVKGKLNMLEAQPGDVPYTGADVSPLNTLTGYTPKTSLQEGLARFGEWYRSYRGK